MYKLCALLTLVMVMFSGCITTSFTTSSLYEENKKVEKLHFIVFGDKETNACMNYYKGYVVNSFKEKNIEADGIYQCCVDIDYNVNEHISASLSKNKQYDYLLVAVVTKAIIGYGTSSARTVSLKLFDLPQNKEVWSGTLVANFSFFMGDQDYKAVAKKISDKTLAELTLKGII
jgi:hypothetical protein